MRNSKEKKREGEGGEAGGGKGRGGGGGERLHKITMDFKSSNIHLGP